MYTYDHFGVIVPKPIEGMTYYPEFKVWTSSYDKNEFRIEFVCFDDGADYHPLIKKMAHVGFVVPDIEEAIKGRNVLKKPTAFGNVLFAFIEENGVPVEFFQKMS